jgi:hypothetical protein
MFDYLGVNPGAQGEGWCLGVTARCSILGAVVDRDCDVVVFVALSEPCPVLCRCDAWTYSCLPEPLSYVWVTP